jgi:CheY-like chemotaxis protein
MTERRHIVFIIDDSEDEIRLTERVLSKIAPTIKVTSALSGEEGLVWLRNCSTLPLLTLLDMKMTGISGIETLRRIRADKRLAHLPVAIVTNSDLPSDHDLAREAGADMVIHKSLDLDGLSGAIWNELERRIRSQSSREIPTAE